MTATDISDADDFSHMLTRAVNAEVEKIIVTGGSASESRDALDIVQGFGNLLPFEYCKPVEAHYDNVIVLIAKCSTAFR